MAKLLNRKSHKVVQWKNGKGKTAEIAVFPPSADFTRDPFLWRLSSAELNEASSFSEFPGYDRFITLVEGKSVLLKFEGGKPAVRVNQGAAIRFSGDDKVFGELPDGKAVDLNLIYRRETVKAGFHVVEIGSKPRSFQLAAKEAYVVGLHGRLSVTLFPGEEKFRISEGDVIQVDMGQTDSGVERLVLLEPAKSGEKCRAALIDLNW